MKKWLKRNEIFFTTICAVILSIAAIFVSWISYRVAQRQTDLDYFEKLPDFQVSRRQIFNEQSKKYESVELEVRKLSGKAKNISVNSVTFLEIQYSNTTGNFRKSRFLINGYFDTTFLSGNTDGLIQTITGHQNQLNAYRLEMTLDSIVAGHSENIATQWTTLLKINYLDFENQEHREYFDASNTGGVLVKSDSLEKYFDFQKSPFSNDNTLSLHDQKIRERILKVTPKIK